MKKKLCAFLLIILTLNIIVAQSVEVGGNNSLKINGTIQSLTSDNNNYIYAVGDFTNSFLRNCVVKYDGKKWSEVTGSSNLYAKGRINAITVDKNNNIYIGGQYKDVLLNKNYVINKYDGIGWSEIPEINALNLNGEIKKMISDGNGNIYVCGAFRNSSNYFYILKYNGSKWIELGGSNSFYQDAIMGNSPSGMVLDGQGNLYVVGVFNKADNGYAIKKFNGTTWSTTTIPISISPCQPMAIAIDSKNNIYHSGCVSGNIAQHNMYIYDGSAWRILGGQNGIISYSTISSIVCDKNDNIYVTITDSASNYYVAKFDGSKWIKYSIYSKFKSGLGLNAMAVLPNSEVVVSGDIINDSSQRYVAKISNLSSSLQTLQKSDELICPNPCLDCELYTKTNFEAEDYVVLDILGKKVGVQFLKSTNGFLMKFPNEFIGVSFCVNQKTGKVIRFVKM